MNVRTTHILFIICTAAAFLLLACSSSNEHVQSDTSQPVSIEQSPSSQQAPVKPKPVSKSLKGKQNSNPGFSLQSDTLEASENRKSTKTTAGREKKVNKKYFAVQIGAFRSEENTQRNISQLQKRFSLPTTYFFDTSLKMNRVFVGNFPTKTEGDKFLSEMRKKYPKEYTNAFVWEFTP